MRTRLFSIFVLLLIGVIAWARPSLAADQSPDKPADQSQDKSAAEQDVPKDANAISPKEKGWAVRLYSRGRWRTQKLAALEVKATDASLEIKQTTNKSIGFVTFESRKLTEDFVISVKAKGSAAIGLLHANGLTNGRLAVALPDAAKESTIVIRRSGEKITFELDGKPVKEPSRGKQAYDTSPYVFAVTLSKGASVVISDVHIQTMKPAPVPTLSQGDKKVREQIKRSIALVMITGEASTTATCVDKSGLFVTSRLPKAANVDGSSLFLVLGSGTRDVKIVEATVIRRDARYSHALLYAPDAAGTPTLASSDPTTWKAGMPFAAFGYPQVHWKDTVKEGFKYPPPTMVESQTTSFSGDLKAPVGVRFRSDLNEGYFGGPVVDNQGRLIAVIEHGRAGKDTTTSASALAQLDTFLASPHLWVNVPEVKYADREKPAEFLVRLLKASVGSDAKAKHEFSINLQIDDGRDKPQVTTMKVQPDDSFKQSLTLITNYPTMGKLPVELIAENGRMSGYLDSATIKADKKPLDLNTVSRIEKKDANWLIALKSGESTTVSEIDFGKTKLIIGSIEATIKARGMKSFVVYSPSAGPDKVKYTITALVKDKPVGSTAGEIEFTKKPNIAEVDTHRPTDQGTANALPQDFDPTTGLPKGKPTFDTDLVVLKLAEPFDSYVFGGAGRFLLVHLKESKKIVIIDVLAGRMAHELDNIAPDVLIAAGRDQFVLVLPNQKLLQRWNFKDFKRDSVARLPGNGTTRIAMMGENSVGPLLLGSDQIATLVDLKTLEPIQLSSEPLGRQDGLPYRMAVSADGQTFAGIKQGISGAAYSKMVFHGSHITMDGFHSTSHATRFALPNANGSLFFVPEGREVFDNHRRKYTVEALKDCAVYPTVDPRWFIAVRFAKSSLDDSQVTHVHFCTTTDRRVVHTLVGIPEMAPTGRNTDGESAGWEIRGGTRRFYYLPWANLMVNPHWSKKRIYLRKVNVMQELEKTGIKYLFVNSLPINTALAGQTYNYQIETASKTGDVKYKLESGPEGMTLSPKGLLRWNVPADAEPSSKAVIVHVSDQSGRELFHTIDLMVKSPTPPAVRVGN